MARPGTSVRRPPSVLYAAGLQLLTAVPFLLSVIVVWTYGADAQAGAEAELTRQGIPASVLADHGISFGSNTAEIPIPAAIILALVVLALFNLAGNRVGRIISWGLPPDPGRRRDPHHPWPVVHRVIPRIQLPQLGRRGSAAD